MLKNIYWFPSTFINFKFLSLPFKFLHNMICFPFGLFFPPFGLYFNFLPNTTLRRWILDCDFFFYLNFIIKSLYNLLTFHIEQSQKISKNLSGKEHFRNNSSSIALKTLFCLKSPYKYKTEKLSEGT